MKKNDLIAKQQLEIERLKKDLARKTHTLQKVKLGFICIGGPLSDNRLAFNDAQLDWLVAIHEEITQIL